MEAINRTITSVTLERSIRQKLRRIAKILDKTESSIMESALKDYFANSTIVKEAQRKIVEYDKYLKSVGRTAKRAISYGGSEGYEYRSQFKEDD